VDHYYFDFGRGRGSVYYAINQLNTY